MKISLLILNLLLALSVGAQPQTWRQIPYFLDGYQKEYAESPKKAALAWFGDARFGLFIHWGPATLYQQGEWVMYNQTIPFDDYVNKTKEFVGDKFNAKDYVDLAVSANMKYITFVAKHHDGYALWDSKASDYNSMKQTPKRDFLKELSQECQKAGIGLFVYYSIGIDWHHPYFLSNDLYTPARPHYQTPPSQYKFQKPEDFKHYMNFAKTQIMEICTQYGPIAGVWFDTIGGIYQNSELFEIDDIYNMIHAIQPHALVVFKTGASGNEDFITGEREMGSLAPLFKSAGLSQKVQDAADASWESNKAKPAELNIPIQTMGWSFNSSPRQRQKSASEVIDLLNYCAKINANLLLNIGPRPDGTILEENVTVLNEVGRYIDKHGFAKVDNDYMKYRSNSTQQTDEEQVNQTAR